MKDRNFVINGDICWSIDSNTVKTMPNAYLVCVEGKSEGVYPRLPKRYANLPLFDYRNKLIIPGLVDLHTHAPQFAFRGLGMDLELLDWLKTRAYPEEIKYENIRYARKAYTMFIDHLKRGPNTRIIIYSTIHVPATMLLMDMLEDSGLVSMSGKVNMDRNCPEKLREKDMVASLIATRTWLDECSARKYSRTKPILTPRFIPSCSDNLMRGLGVLSREFDLPVQSHLSENRKEVEWVRQLCPQSYNYAAAYSDFGLLGSKTTMAHCVWLDDKEISLAEK